MATLRVVLDTNVLLSGIAYPGSVPGKILTAWRHGALDLVLSDYILDELRRVLPRLSHRHGLSETEMDDLVDMLAIQADIISPAPLHDTQLRDPADQPVLGTVIQATLLAAAQYLVTGDKDLLVLGDKYPIITPAAFWEKHGGM